MLENYGAFASPVKEGEGFENRHPHIAAVVVVHERLYSTDWREEILARYRVPNRSMDAAIEAYLEAQREIDAASERGEEPEGSYRWVSVYDVNGDEAVPLPEGWFNGPRDERYGFGEGGYRGRCEGQHERPQRAGTATYPFWMRFVFRGRCERVRHGHEGEEREVRDAG
jgi:hypothetical protein